MRPILFISSWLLAMIAFAQDPEEDTVQTTRTVIPSIYVDYGKLLSIPFPEETKIEGGFELLFWNKVPLIVEAGSAKLSPEQAFSNGTYESNGFYYRIGTGIYSQFQLKNKLGLTVRYGSSSFDESRRITVESPSGLQNSLIESVESANLTANWYEVVIYSDRRLNDLFSIGLNVRLRILQNYDQQSPIDVYAIPGYGRSFDKSIPAANLFLKVSF